MGAITAFLAAAKSIDTAAPIHALDRQAYRELKALQAEHDFAIPAAFQAADEVQSIAVYDGTVTGGTFTLTVLLASGESFTTADIAYDADAATIETAIDVAATTASVTGWTNGDISVSGGPMTTDPLVLTYDGDSVAEANHGLIVVDSESLTGGGEAGACSVTTEGQADRPGYAILSMLGIFSGTTPAWGVVPSSGQVFATPGERRLSPDTIKAIALEIAIAEGNESIYTTLVAALGV